MAATPWDALSVWQSSGFLAFLQDHGIQRSDLIVRKSAVDSAVQAPVQEELRFFRLKQGFSVDGAIPEDQVLIESIAQSLKAHNKDDSLAIRPRAVAWLPGFYSLPTQAPLARLELYQQGALYGIDISSGYAVNLLKVVPGDHVLDLCCAPGAKLTMIADLLKMQGSVTGVDFSRQRIGACKQLVHKYKLIHAPASDDEAAVAQAQQQLKQQAPWRCRLFHADGRTFSVGPQTEDEPGDCFELVLDTNEIACRGAHTQNRKRKNKSARARDRKRLKVNPVEASVAATRDQPLYDKVLVDAECTHDGSIRHLQKLDSEEKWTQYVQKHLSSSQVDRILQLQHDLIRNGFALLKPDGVMVYSTCSLSLRQNEDIVRGFLNEHAATAVLEPIDREGIPCQEGRIPGTVRFTPSNQTSGLFIAKIRKRAHAPADADATSSSP